MESACNPPHPTEGRATVPIWSRCDGPSSGFKALIDSERAHFERGAGPLCSAAFLQVLLRKESFAWLRPFSGLVVKIDEALAAADPIPPIQAHGYIREVHDLVLDSSDPVANHRLGEVLQRDAAVQFAHVS